MQNMNKNHKTGIIFQTLYVCFYSALIYNVPQILI